MKNTIKKLSAMPYAQAHVEIDEEGIIYLFSYVTCVATIANDWLEVYGLYSSTTRRHIGAFMKEYIEWPNGTRGEYKTAKILYENGWRLNIATGEIEDMPG